MQGLPLVYGFSIIRRPTVIEERARSGAEKRRTAYLFITVGARAQKPVARTQEAIAVGWTARAGTVADILRCRTRAVGTCRTAVMPAFSVDPLAWTRRGGRLSRASDRGSAWRLWTRCRAAQAYTA